MPLGFTIVTKTIQNEQPYYGVVKMAHIDSTHPTWNYGAAGWAQTGVARVSLTDDGYSNVVFEVKMPQVKDLGVDEILKVELEMDATVFIYDCAGAIHRTDWYVVCALVEIPDDFTQGTKEAESGWCNWQQRIDAVGWANEEGAVHSRQNIDAADGLVIATLRVYGGTPYDRILKFDITDLIGSGERKRFCIFVGKTNIPEALCVNYGIVEWKTFNNVVLSRRPRIKITGKNFQVDAFDTDDSQLKIEPYEGNPEFPLLSWGGVDDDDFTQFKLYRDTSPITDVTALTPIFTTTDRTSQEFIDDTIPTDGSGDGITYYYMCIAEDVDNTGNEATKSKNVSFLKPDILFVAHPLTMINVGEMVDVTVISSLTRFNKMYVDWKDGSQTWYEFDITQLVQLAVHYYSAYTPTTITVQARIENEDGFWSSLKNATTNLTVYDTNPVAKLIARPLEIVLGETIIMNSGLSHPIASNCFINQQKYFYDGSDTGWLTETPRHEWTPNPAPSSLPVTYPIKCRVRTSPSIKESADSNIEYVTVIADEPELLQFSRDTKISMRQESKRTVITTAMIEGGDGEVDIRGGVSNVELKFDGISSKVNLDADLSLIRNAVELYTYVRIVVYDEICGSEVYYDGRIIDYSITKSANRYASWSITFRVVKRTVVP